MTMDARNANETRNHWAIGLRTATVVVVLGTLAAVWHPAKFATASHVATVASNDTAATPDMSVYFPARFSAPESVIEQPPTF
jgi:hypothetical protein